MRVLVKIPRVHVVGMVSLLATMMACEGDTRAPAATAATLASAGRAAPAHSPLADANDGPGDPSGAMDAGLGSSTRSVPAALATANGDGDSPAAAIADPEPALEPASEPTRPARERFPRPSAIRGFYANAWAAGSSSRVEELLGMARRTEVNALVIDIKDASGYVSHRTKVPLAHEIGATGEIRIRDLPGLLERLEREGVYPIARIVIVKDPILAEFRPELAVNDIAGGAWVDSKGFTWLNPYSREVWDYHVALAREVAQLGFPEIQYDYVRFPDAPQEDLARAVYLGADGRSKPEIIRAFLQYAREELADLDVELTADVFGVTTSARRDVGIGQVWESFIDAVDAALPMVYPSHYWQGSFGFQRPNAHPYEIVRRALRDALERSALVDGAGRTIPWLQDFSLGQPPYTSAEVRAQIQATYDAGIDEWILWNPGSRYTELALEPVQGFDGEPYIRLANRLVPVSERWAVLDSVAVARADSLRTIRADGPVDGNDTPAAPAAAAAGTSAATPDSLGANPD
jgi:hypothetical protein